MSAVKSEATPMFAMNAIDRAWLEMDEPGNPMVISAIFQLEGPVDAAKLQQELVERLLRYPRFRQKVRDGRGAPCWVEDEHLDFRYHVAVRRLPAAGFARELRKAISAEISRDLDRERPLWRLCLFPHKGGGPVTVFFRAHHALADGVALVTLLIDSTDTRLARSAIPVIPSGGSAPRGGPLGNWIDRLEALNTGLERLGVSGELEAAAQAAGPGAQDPRDAGCGVARPAPARRQAARLQGAAVRLPQRSLERGVVPLAPVRAFAQRHDVRPNDVLIAALAGAFGRQLRAGGMHKDLQNLRVSIPVNMRNGRGRELGNQFGLVLLDLPVGETDPLQRLETVAQRMASLKTSLEARITLLGLTAAGHLPVPIEKRIVGAIGAKSSAVVSSLPGPKRHVHIAGAKLKNLVFWPPQAGGIGIGISFFSYGGALSVGISADRNLLPNPQGLLADFMSELNQLCAHRAARGAAADAEKAAETHKAAR